MGVNHNPRDLIGAIESQVRPVGASVGGAVNAISERNVIADLGFSRADPNDVWITGIDRDGSYRGDSFMLQKSLPCNAAVVGAKQAAVGRSNVIGEGLTGHASHSRDAAPGNGGTDLPEGNAFSYFYRQQGAAFFVRRLRPGGARGHDL